MSKPNQQRPETKKDDLIDWFTVSYRSIYIGAGVLAAILLGGYLYLRPPTATVATPRPSGEELVRLARFTELQGSVRVKSEGSIDWVAADTNTALRKGDLVRTGSNATASIEFFDETVVQMQPEALLTIEESSVDPRTKQKGVGLSVSSGVFSYNKPATSGSTQVSTPTARVTQGAGEGAGGLRVDQSGETELRVFAGSNATVETRGGAPVSLQANEGLRVDSSGKAGSKLALPGTPALLAPPHQGEIPYPDPARATTLLVWKAVQGAQTYHVVVADSASFTQPVADQQVTDTTVPVRGLGVGKYYWRVAAVGKDRLEGLFSDFSRFAVVRSGASGAGTPPALQIDALDLRTNILQIKGRSEPGATLTVNGQQLELQADGSFNEFVTLEQVGQQQVVVRAVGQNGGVSEKRPTVVVAPF